MRKVLVLFWLAFTIAAQKNPVIYADYQKQEGDKLVALGNVEVKLGKLSIYADQVEFDLKKNELFFKGNVSVFSGKGFLTGDELYYNIDTSFLKVKNAWGRFEPGIIIQAEEIQGKEEKIFEFKKGAFTPCIQPCPNWQIKVKKGKLIREDHVSLWGALLKIKGVSLLYFPYLYYPLPKRKRKTGFLMPSVGYNTTKGYIVGEEFFWAPAEWLDFTLSAQYMSNIGSLYGLEYRYIRNPGNYGNAEISFIKNKQTGATDFILKGKEIHNLGKGWRLEGNFDLVSSYEFLKNYSNDYNRSTQRAFYSLLYLTKSWPGVNLAIKVDEQRSFFRAKKRIFRHLPEVNLTVSRKKISRKLPFYLSARIVASKVSSGVEDQWSGISRLVLRPSLSLPLPVAPWLTIDTNYNLNYNLYSDSYLEGTKELSGEDLSLLQHVLTVTVTGPVFYRIYDTPSLKYSPKFKHVIEPVFTFHYAPEVTARTRIIAYDRYDRFYYTNRLSFTLNNRILAKKKIGEERSPVEIFTFSLGGHYYFQPEKELGSVTKLGKTPYFSTLSYYLRFSPENYASLYLRGEYDPYYKAFLYRTLSLTFTPRKVPFSINLNYSWQNRVNDLGATVTRNFLRLGGFLKIKPLRLTVRGSADYDFLQKQLQQYTVFVTYDLQCVAILFYYSYMPFREREHQFSFSIMLPQVGFTPDKLGGMR